MTEVILALGANLGDRLANLQSAIDLLAERGVRVTRTSSVWQTDSIPAGQPPYLNAVVAAETDLSPRDLLVVAKEIERMLGREPAPRWSPRPADIDILFYDGASVTEPDLQVPHVRIGERAFVLAPLAEVLTGELPVMGGTAAARLADVDTAGIEKTLLHLSVSG